MGGIRWARERYKLGEGCGNLILISDGYGRIGYWWNESCFGGVASGCAMVLHEMSGFGLDRWDGISGTEISMEGDGMSQWQKALDCLFGC